MKDFQLSDNEKKIIALLIEDSKMSYKKIARKTGVAISTVHNIIKRLVNQEVIKNFSVNVDAGKIGYDLTVVIGVMTSHGSLTEVEKRLIEHPNVCQVLVVTGEYDLFVIAKFKNSSELDNFLRRFLQTTPGTERTNTSVVLSTLKERLNPTIE